MMEVAGATFTPSDLAHLVNMWHQAGEVLSNTSPLATRHDRLMWAARQFARYDTLKREWPRVYVALNWALED